MTCAGVRIRSHVAHRYGSVSVLEFAIGGGDAKLVEYFGKGYREALQVFDRNEKLFGKAIRALAVWTIARYRRTVCERYGDVSRTKSRGSNGLVKHVTLHTHGCPNIVRQTSTHFGQVTFSTFISTRRPLLGKRQAVSFEGCSNPP